MSELRECPCGRPAVISESDIAGRRSAHCDDQDCYWSIVGFSDEQVSERWNRRPDPAPVGVRVPEKRYTSHDGMVGTTAADDIWNDCVDEILRLNPQPGALVGELRRADFINGYKAGAADYSDHGINHAELANDAIQSADHERYTLTNTDKGSSNGR